MPPLIPELPCVYVVCVRKPSVLRSSGNFNTNLLPGTGVSLRRLHSNSPITEFSSAFLTNEYHQKVEAGETQQEVFPPENAMRDQMEWRKSIPAAFQSATAHPQARS